VKFKLKSFFYPFLILAISVGLLFLFVNRLDKHFLSFSDGAKFADIARNVLSGFGYSGKFTFWSNNIIELTQRAGFPSQWTPPLMPLSMAFYFKIFGVSDLSVIATSSTFFVLLILFTFLLGEKLFGNLAGFLAAVAVAVSPNFLDYATSGASESLFTFQIVATAYFFTLKKKWAVGLGIIFMILMYFTRPQAFIYIAGLLLYWLLINFKNKKAILYFFGVIVSGFLVDKFILANFAGKYFLYPILARGKHALTQIAPSSSSSDVLRGAAEYVTIISSESLILSSAKKIFYYLYNYYKLLPQIASPYIWTLFIVGLFKWGKNRIENSLKLVTIFMVIVTFLVAALTIPFFRYIHPIIPLVYLLAIATLVWIVQIMINGQWLIIKKWPIVKKYNKKQVVTGISTLLILFFVVGQTLGAIFLDSRFKAARTNKGKPPVYVELSWALKENTNPGDVIITNLDTWGSWYGERKTIWFPLKPNQLMPPEGEQIPFDAIYLTSHLMDDENYYMGEEWRQVFYNPENPENEFIAENYELKEIIGIESKDVYEKQSARAVLLVKKSN